MNGLNFNLIFSSPKSEDDIPRKRVYNEEKMYMTEFKKRFNLNKNKLIFYKILTRQWTETNQLHK